MSDIVIKVENLSKQYRLGTVGTGTLSHDLNRWWHQIRGKEDPYLKIGEVNDRSIKGNSDYVWALQDINFEVKRGEVLGIIGKNGAGKSTLLKILSRTTSPTAGQIKIKGRVASLLEVGTGFHPELSGKENIYLNGAILGMSRREISGKFDEIVDFAEVERYIDTPVKRYSSGMYVRLAFAVAAHLDPDILIVDEVLAVGDIDFQKKCLGKIHDISTNFGRTVLFVSHNMASLKSLCITGVLMQNGCLTYQGLIKDTVQKYENQYFENLSAKWINNESFKNKATIESIKVFDVLKNEKERYLSSEEIFVELIVCSTTNINNVKVGFDLIKDDLVAFRTHQIDSIKDSFLLENERKVYICEIPKGLLNEGTYSIKPQLSIHCVESLLEVQDPVLHFKIDLDTTISPFHSVLNENNHPGIVYPILNWDVKCIKDPIIA